MQVRLFASHILKDDWLDRRDDRAWPDRQPLARLDIKVSQPPICPTAAFGASNSPRDFSVAGRRHGRPAARR